MRYKNIAFDIDGTLLDTEFADLSALKEVLKREMGVEKTLKELHPALGVPSEDILRLHGAEAGDAARLARLWSAAMTKYFDTVRLFPGVEEMLGRLRGAGVRLGIVTSKNREEYATDFVPFGVAGLFDAVVLADDTQRHKPEPEPLLKYMERTGAAPGETLYVGDSIYDLQCALGAGVDFALAEWCCNCPEPERATHRLAQPSDVLSTLL